MKKKLNEENEVTGRYVHKMNSNVIQGAPSPSTLLATVGKHIHLPVCCTPVFFFFMALSQSFQ